MDALKCLTVRACQTFLWAIGLLLEPVLGTNLVAGSKEERKEAKVRGRHAHLVKIWARATTFKQAQHDLTNFLYTHHAYVPSSYALTHDNVTLHSFTDDLVIFAVSDPQVVQLKIEFIMVAKVRAASSEVSPFLWAGAFNSAKVPPSPASRPPARSRRGGRRPNQRGAQRHNHPQHSTLWVHSPWAGERKRHLRRKNPFLCEKLGEIPNKCWCFI